MSGIVTVDDAHGKPAKRDPLHDERRVPKTRLRAGCNVIAGILDAMECNAVACFVSLSPLAMGHRGSADLNREIGHDPRPRNATRRVAGCLGFAGA